MPCAETCVSRSTLQANTIGQSLIKSSTNTKGVLMYTPVNSVLNNNLTIGWDYKHTSIYMLV